MSQQTQTPAPKPGDGTPDQQAAQQQSGTPVSQQPPKGASEGAGQQPVTHADLESFGNQLRTSLLATTIQAADKRGLLVEDRLKNLETSIETMRKAGMQITDQQADAMRVQTYQEAVKESVRPQQKPDQSAPAKAQPDQGEQVLLNEVARLEQEAGITLADDDPEMESVVEDQGPYAFVKSVEAALAAKKARVNPPGTTDNAPGGDNARGRLPSSQGNQPVIQARSSKDYWKLAHKT